LPFARHDASAAAMLPFALSVRLAFPIISNVCVRHRLCVVPYETCVMASEQRSDHKSPQHKWHPPDRVRAILSDVDGTLLPFGTSRNISPGNIGALQRAIDSGVHVGLATGRIPGRWSDSIRAQLPGIGASVFANGGLVMGAAGEVVWEASLPPEAVRRVCSFCCNGRAAGKGRIAVLATTRCPMAGTEYGSLCYVELAPEGETFATALIQSAQEPACLLRDFRALEAEDQRVIKFVIFTDPNDRDWAPMPAVVQALQAELQGTGATVLDCGAKQCEVFAPGVNKGTGVLRLLEHLGSVSVDEVMVLGDAENDVEMLKLAGAGVAMGNANEYAKRAADVVVSTSDEDGVAEAVRRFVFCE